jgi:hypothetical protein
MHIIELISEASIFTRTDKYKFGHKVRVGASSSKGKALLAAIQEKVPAFDPAEDLTWVETAPKRGLKAIQFGVGDTVRYFKRPNNTYIAITGTDSAIQSGMVHAPGQKGSTEGNVGDLSEPVLSAAVVAKLIKRGGNSIEDVNNNDVIKVLNAAINSGQSNYTVEDKNSRIADLIHFTLAVREPTKVFMQSPDFWEKYQTILPSAVHYANSGQIDRYADHFYKNGKVDAVWVKSDGMSDQKSKKTDIEAYVNKNGKAVALKNLKISLKAGSSQFGQMGAGSITKDINSEKHALSVAKKFFGDLGVAIQAPAAEYVTKADFWTDFYKQAEAQLKGLLSGNDVRTETGVVAKIANMIVNHATKGDQEVKLVQLGSKGVSSVHSFKGLYHKLIANHINLEVSLRIGKSKTNGEPRPEITIKDATSGKALIKLGYHATGDNKKIWNSVLMEPLLSELTATGSKPQTATPATNQQTAQQAPSGFGQATAPVSTL